MSIAPGRDQAFGKLIQREAVDSGFREIVQRLAHDVEGGQADTVEYASFDRIVDKSRHVVLRGLDSQKRGFLLRVGKPGLLRDQGPKGLQPAPCQSPQSSMVLMAAAG